MAIIAERADGRPTRRAVILAGAVFIGSILVIAGCGVAADRAVSEQKNWKSMLEEQGTKVEQDLASVGLMGYRPLVSLNRLSEEKRQLIPSLPPTGYLFAEETPAGVNVRFLWPAGSEQGDSLLVTVPYKLVRDSIFLENSVTSAKITFDLAKFISYQLVSDRNPRYQRGQFTLTRYDDPMNYLNTPNAIIGVDIIGNRDNLAPIFKYRTAI